MTKMIIPATLCVLLSGLGTARADVVVSASLAVAPPAPAPIFVPPAPAIRPPLIPMHAHDVAPRVVVSNGVVTGGQWVYTAQNGWIYMPYGDQYVYSDTGSAYAYVYYPAVGWRWLTAPWLIGSGPYPYFGTRGPFAYGWYRGLERSRHPWGAHYARLHGRPWVAPRAVVPPRPAPGVRATAVRAPARVPGPARVQAPARAQAPARPAATPRPLTSPRSTMVAQRNVGSAVRGPAPARGGSGGARAIARR
jgi:hypothetical protein